MSIPRVKITGARGDWTAEVKGRRLAVLHNTWWQPPHTYRDPMEGVKHDGKRFQTYLTALQEHDQVVMQRDVKGGLARDGYIGVFFFENPVVNDDGSVSLQILARHADPA